MSTPQPHYDKLLDPIQDVNHAIEGLLNHAFGPLSGDQREGLKRIYANAWGLHTLFMDVVTALGIENIAQRDYLRAKFAQHADPLVSVSRALLDGMDGPLTEEQAVSLVFIEESGQFLQRCIAQLWLHSQLHHNLLKVQLQTTSLEAVLDPMHMPLSTREVALELEVPATLPAVRCDAVYLQQCVHQVIDNAIQATPTGKIRVTTSIVRDHAQIMVRDTGRGIPVQDHAHIFEPFFQIDATQAGLGLGLTIVQSLMRLQGGTVRLTSQLKRGTTIILSIPIASG